MAISPVEMIISASTVKEIIASVTMNMVIPRATQDDIVATSSMEMIVPAPSIDERGFVDLFIDLDNVIAAGDQHHDAGDCIARKCAHDPIGSPATAVISLAITAAITLTVADRSMGFRRHEQGIHLNHRPVFPLRLDKDNIFALCANNLEDAVMESDTGDQRRCSLSHHACVIIRKGHRNRVEATKRIGMAAKDCA